MRLIDVDRLIELMNERDADCSEPKNAVDIGYSLAVEHMKYEIEQNNEYHCKIYDVDIKQCECKKPKTNADRIRSMSDEDLTKIIMCPYDTAGKPIEIMPCVRDGNVQELVPPEDCKKCMIEWLQSEVEE